MKLRNIVYIAVICLFAGSAPAAVPAGNPHFSVAFTNCVESIGVGLAPTANVRPLVPAEFIPVGEGQPVTPLVVRTARCRIAVAGLPPRSGSIVQIGAVVVPPDGTGDINNYTIWYYTSDLPLAAALRLTGVDAQFVPTLDYDYDPVSNDFAVRVPFPGAPRFSVAGTVAPSAAPAGSFLANWWRKTPAGRIVRMSTSVPSIAIGGANLTLATAPGSRLGQLVGGGVFGFPIIQQFNNFAVAGMTVGSSMP
ncbi:MAG: hypothetical protein JSS81_24960 [Acidobacteria bacterium]|nr:hypothetical protein [Acidobacteriota bacterium]